MHAQLSVNLINAADSLCSFMHKQIAFNLCVQNSELNDCAAICTNIEYVVAIK